MLLTEQIIKRLSRDFWHGSQYENWDKEKSKYKVLYVTTSIRYAIRYSKNDIEEIDKCKYLTKYNLKKQVNFFNARSKKDIITLENYCRTHNLYTFLKNIYLLQNEDWLNVFSKEEKNQFVKILEKNGFDGFVNFEANFGTVYRMTSNTYGFSGIGVFNENNLIKVKQYKGWEQIKEVDEIKAIRDSQIKELKYLFWKKEKIYTQSYSFLIKKEINNIIDNFDFKKENKNFKLEEKRKKEYFKQKWLDWTGALPDKQTLDNKVFRSFLNPIL